MTSLSVHNLEDLSNRCVWIQNEIRRIGRSRFESAYWPSLDQAILNSVETHSHVICDPNKDNALAGFVLVCPPPNRQKAAKWGLSLSHFKQSYEIAFLAVDAAWEGRGLARQLMSAALTYLDNCWLHVDFVNPRAAKLYESLGFRIYATQSDPYGSMGYLMQRLQSQRAKFSWDTHGEKGAALFYAGPSEAEHSFSGCIFAPPRVSSDGHAFPCLA